MLVYGKNVIYELLISNEKIQYIIMSKKFSDEKITNLIIKKGIKITIKEKNDIDDMLGTNTQGIIAKINDFQYKSLDDCIIKLKNKQYPLFIMLDQITDIHNLASIVRVCECVGVDGIIIPKTRSAQINADVFKISSGAIFNIDIIQVSNINNAIKKLKENDFWIVGSDLQTNNLYTNVDYKMKMCLVIGSEGKGIRELTRKHCDFLVKIPMVGKINSLNASVATGILCYQIFNDRKE
ncbi:MAG: 23S rRNA (guanosine(2251)-2'-O)-methyltransferase RlmB [Bacilli bacterium]